MQRLVTRLRLAAIVGSVWALSSCTEDGENLLSAGRDGLAGQRAPVPSPLSTINADGEFTIWPYTSADLENPSDPVNVVLVGEADPRSIRQALLGLDNDRSSLGLPPVAPFDCTWEDAIGGHQGAYSGETGWSGSVIQLQCGDYEGLRFHLRLFRAGGRTIANAHFETIIPATTEHQVLSWELAEQFTVGDLGRTGVLSATPSQTISITQSPYREIPPEIYNLLPEELKALIGGPPGQQPGPVPMANDGRATVLSIGEAIEPVPGHWVEEFTVLFDQVLPKPFCVEGSSPYVYITGPVYLRQEVSLNGEGILRTNFHARGSLQVTPIDPTTTPPTPVAPTYQAKVSQVQTAVFGNRQERLSQIIEQRELPPALGRGSLRTKLTIAREGRTAFEQRIVCGE